MPAKFIVRDFQPNSFYHVYNKGFGKENIFLHNEDYKTFVYYLTAYLLPWEKVQASYPNIPSRLKKNNLNGQVELISYCLMPNHFHLLLKQTTKDGVPKLLRQLSNAYTSYFHSQYQKEGPVFSGTYKAAHVQIDQLLDLIRLIHLNPTVAWIVDQPKDYEWSSHKEYLKGAGICYTEAILDQFSSVKEFDQFILDQKGYSQNLNQLKSVAIDI